MFDKNNIGFFSFDGYEYNKESGIISFNYSFDDSIHFVEKLTFSDGRRALTDKENGALSRIFDYLHIAIGISYYKAALPKKILLKNVKLSQKSCSFFQKLYTVGLQEFSYTNNITLEDRVNFTPSKVGSHKPINLNLRKMSVIPMGGGKDSFVSQNILIDNKKPHILLHIGNHDALRVINKDSHIIRIQREISPNLHLLNKNNAYNGHIPISAIYAFITLACSVIYDFDTVIMSNERSANTGSLMPNGKMVNHQYSKSYEFELDFINLVNNEILTSYRYFSILRPFSEISIAKIFSKNTREHHNFISCNNASKQKNGQQKWCMNCPKCRFVFLSLAPFLEKDKLMNIFKINLLNDPDQLHGYLSLVGINSPKPFECVGEVQESIVAFYLLSQKPEWSDDISVFTVNNEILQNIDNLDCLAKEVLTPNLSTHNIPREFLKTIEMYYDS